MEAPAKFVSLLHSHSPVSRNAAGHPSLETEVEKIVNCVKGQELQNDCQ